MKPEAQFEKDLANAARNYGFLYIKIPDTRMINAGNRHRNREEKRPFDAILITKNQNYCIECKVNSGKLMPHQEANQKVINGMNESFYVLRKRIRKSSVAYQIEYEGEMCFESDNLLDIIECFDQNADIC